MFDEEKYICDKINDGDYKASLPYPSQPKAPTLLRDLDYIEVNKLASDIYEAKMIEFVKIRQAYQVDKDEKMKRFKNDALDYCGLSNHPKADKIYSYAWAEGHSSGLHEVLSKLEEIAELFLD